MKKGMLMLALVGLLVTPAMADWDHPFKVDQLYPVSSWGAFSHIDTDSDPVWAPQIADDWLCTQSEWVTDLHLNGWSQYGPTWVDAFHITIWNDVPAGPDDESHPGYLMAEFDVFPDEIEGPSEGFHYDDVDDIWAINFPEADWFWQEEGNIYWISAQGVMFEDGYPEYFAWNFVRSTEEAAPWFLRQGYVAVGDWMQGRSLRTRVLVREGLLGIEVMYSGYEAKTTGSLTRLAERHNILTAGGSDFHGDPESDIQVGTGKAELRVPYRFAESLREAAQVVRRKAAELAPG